MSFINGALSHETATPIAKKILSMFRGQRLSIAHVVIVPDSPIKIDLVTGEVLQPVDEHCTNALVHISREEHSRQHPRDDSPKMVSLTFQDDGNTFNFTSRLQRGGDHEDYEHPHFSFVQERGGALHITERLPDVRRPRTGTFLRVLKLTTIKVEGPMLNDPALYSAAVLKAHFRQMASV